MNLSFSRTQNEGPPAGSYLDKINTNDNSHRLFCWIEGPATEGGSSSLPEAGAINSGDLTKVFKNGQVYVASRAN